MSDLNIKYWWKFHVKSESDGTPCSLAAWFFRKLAAAIDGKQSLSIDVASTPCVSKEEQIAIIQKGIHFSCEMFQEAVRREALEEAMKESCPQLFEKDDDQQ